MRGSRRWLLGGFAAAWLALAGAALAVPPPGPTPDAGPPFPPPITDVVVYDYANILSAETTAAATRIISNIEQRVGAEVVVYTQLKPGADDASTDEDAIALIDQWGVGRRGFDDGLAIMWNVKRDPCQPGVPGNGNVRLYAAPGYAAAYLSNAERQQIFDEQMLPELRECDEDDALLAALRAIDANATPEHAAFLQTARFIDAAIGLLLAPVLFLLIVGWAVRAWLLYGRDPVYLDSPSILMPAPPPNLTAASGAAVWEGRATRRALTVALLDLASRGEMTFVPEKKLLSEKAGIQLEGGETNDPYVLRNRRRPLSGAEELVLRRLNALNAGRDGYLDPEDLQKFAPTVQKFSENLEQHVTRQGWFREPPGKATARWLGRGILVLILGIVSVAIAFNLPSSGLTLLGGALIAAGVVLMAMSGVMPARTMPGAMIYAMLAAYRRTLHKTMEQSRSMNEVVQRSGLDWLETPDQAVVWGTALGLHAEVEEVIKRSVEDAQRGVTSHNPWVPRWYGAWAADRGSAGAGGGRPGLAPGLMSSSALPNFGGMFAALGTVGTTPSSSGGGSGGFSGGSSGGGGGGAGGGY